MKFSKCLICLCMIAYLNATWLYATETINTNNTQINEVENIDNKELQEQKENLKKEISGLIEELRVGIVSIDEKVEILRKTDEYLTYPTIRLNIDTPIFGIKSIINQKLRITKDVSAGDVAKGYSIRDIVKNKIIKVPDLKVGNIIVSTREVNIEDELSVTEYNSLVLKLMNYIDKVESVKEFLDTQTNKMFKDYVSKEKQEKLEDFANRLEKINNNLLNKNSDLVKMNLVEYNEDYIEIEEKYIELSKKQKELKKQSSDVLIESSKLNNLQKDIISLESEVIDISTKIDDENVEKLEQIKIDEVYVRVYDELQNKLQYIEKYEEDSKIEKEIKEEFEENKEISDEIESNVQDENLNEEDVKTTEVITVYEVFSDKSINNMKDVIEYMEKRMEELDIPYSEEKEIENTENVNEDIGEENKEPEKLAYENLTEEEIENEFEYIIQKYNEFLKYEYSFYLDNVNGLLDLTNTKVKNIAAVTETDIILEAKYVYIDLPVNLDKYLDTYNVNSNIEIKYLISNFKNELQKLCDNYLSLVELYEKLNVDELLNKA